VDSRNGELILCGAPESINCNLDFLYGMIAFLVLIGVGSWIYNISCRVKKYISRNHDKIQHFKDGLFNKKI